MKLIISNNIRIQNPTAKIKEYCSKNLVLNNPDYIIAQRLGHYVGKMPQFLKLYSKDANDLILPFGTLQNVWKIARNSEYELKFNPCRLNKMQGSINLYNYQKQALNELILKKNGVLEAPCGSGKTMIGLQLIKELGFKALWLTHTEKLLEQSKTRCESNFKGDFGTITKGEVNIGNDITFATVQTMSKLDPEIYKNAFDIVIVDECHHCVGSPTKVMQFYKVVSNCNCRYKYGMSATLTRSDGMINSLYSIIGDLIYSIKKEDVGDKTIKAVHIPVNIDLDYNEMDYLNADGTLNYCNLINMLSTNKERNEIICSKVFDNFTKGRKQIILCERLSQVDYLAKEIKKFCKVSILTGKIQKKDREYDADVIVTTFKLSKEGLDIPELDCLHLAMIQKDKSTVLQSVGRIERNVQDKKQPICFDYVDTKISYCISAFKKRKRILK